MASPMPQSGHEMAGFGGWKDRRVKVRDDERTKNEAHQATFYVLGICPGTVCRGAEAASEKEPASGCSLGGELSTPKQGEDNVPKPHGGRGTCFSLDGLHDEKYFYLVTAAHLVYCGEHQCYKKCAIRLPTGKEKNSGYVEHDRARWIKVPQKYLDNVDKTLMRNRRYRWDYAVIALPKKSKAAGSIPECKLKPFTMKEDFFPQAFVGGFPATVDGEEDCRDMYWVPHPVPGQRTPECYRKNRSLAERASDAVYTLPQRHHSDEPAADGNRDSYDYTDDETKGYVFRHYIDTSAGQSGAPLVTRADQHFTAIGIHVGFWWMQEAGGDKKKQSEHCFNVAVKMPMIYPEIEKWIKENQDGAAPSEKDIIASQEAAESEDFSQLAMDEEVSGPLYRGGDDVPPETPPSGRAGKGGDVADGHAAGAGGAAAAGSGGGGGGGGGVSQYLRKPLGDVLHLEKLAKNIEQVLTGPQQPSFAAAVVEMVDPTLTCNTPAIMKAMKDTDKYRFDYASSQFAPFVVLAWLLDRRGNVTMGTVLELLVATAEAKKDTFTTMFNDPKLYL